MIRQKTAGIVSRAKTQGHRVGHASCPASGNALPPAPLCGSAPLRESFWVAAGGRQGRTGSTTRAIMRHRLDAPLREAKPIPGEARWDEAGGTGDEGQMRQTNPIWPGWPARGERGRQTPPGHDDVKQTQFGPRQNEGQVVYGKGVMAERTCKEHWKNKANSSIADFGLRIVDCAKRTQFPTIPGDEA